VANTSNMPVAAREASVYTGVTIAEYYREMGYDVALMADSTSRWAEALREISGRQEEMPGEEGYPAYLATRIAEFYERSGRVRPLGRPGREGTLTIIGAVSPPGGDLSDPVVQATLKVVKVFWGLDAKLAYRRHFPAIDWLASYSLYLGTPGGGDGEGWAAARREAMALLQREAELVEIARLVGRDTLSTADQHLLESAHSLREDFLHQNAFAETDQFSPLPRQLLVLRAVLDLHEAGAAALGRGAALADVLGVPGRTAVAGFRDLPPERLGEVAVAVRTAREALGALGGGGAP
jgi:V/A-type H+-transporting ATPase subunit A